MATIGGMKIATTGSGHCCPGPTPAMSLIPPPPPAGPVPAPFAYIALSSTAGDTSDKLKVGGDPVLVNGSKMDVQQPGNIPSQTTGGDVVTHMVDKACGVFTGSSKVKAGGKEVACTMDSARLNMPMPNGMVAQTIGKLVTADMLRAASDPSVYAAGDLAILDPISVATGAVVDETADLVLPGLVPVTFTRRYSSLRNKEHTPLGRGGWSHSYHQWIDLDGPDARLCDGDGATVTIAGLGPKEPAFLRSRRLVVTRDGRGGATVRSLATRLTRVFAPTTGARAFLREITDGAGHKVRFEYDEHRLARILDTAGRVVELGYDRGDHLVKLAVFPPAPAEARGAPREPVYAVTYAYGGDGELVSAADALGQAETYAYDEHRRLARKTTPDGISFHYRYDEGGRCVRAWGDGGIHLGELEYDLDKGITRLTGNAEPRIFHWRPKDGVVLGQATPDGELSLENAYDDDLYLLEAKNAAGDVVKYEHDERGNLTKFTDPRGVTTEYAYHDDLPVRRESEGLVTEYANDHRGLLLSVRYPTGASLALSYDEQARLCRIDGPSGPRASFGYDEQHNVVEERMPRGGVRRWQFDALGRPVAFSNPLGRVMRRELDAAGRAKLVYQPDGATIRLERDGAGRVRERTDEAGRVWTTRYAGTRSPVELGQPDGTAWQLAYDLLERPQEVKNPRGESFEYRYDRAGNVRELRTFDGRVLRFSRTKAQRVARVEQPDGTFRAYLYDAMGFVAAEDTPHGTITIEDGEEALVYLLDEESGPVEVRLERDAFRRVVREVQNGRAIAYEHDAQNRCTRRVLPTGHETRYFYDEENRLSALEHDGRRVEIERDLTGAVVRRIYPGGVETRLVLDALSRLTRTWVGAGQKTLVDRTYGYDATSALVERNDLRWGRSRYRHDLLGRLVEATTPAGHEGFEYDAGGSLRPAGAPWKILAGGLLQRTEAATFGYDECSRRAERSARGEDDDEVTEYSWDCRSRLREVLRPDGTRVLFTYDALGRRVRKEVIDPIVQPSRDELPPDVPKRRLVEYLWEGNNVVAELDSERGTRVFVHEPGTMVPLLQQEEGGAVYAVVADHLGTVTELVDEKGQLAWSALHSAWGRVVKTEAPPREGARPVSSHRLLGQWHDEETGLCYVRYRYFDPEVARFVSPDPMELSGGPNLFAFNGSPTSHVDPLGLACILMGDPRTDSFINYIMTYRVPKAAQYEVYVHGTSTGVAAQDGAGNWKNYSPQELQDRIRNAGNYNGENVYLNSCNTGRTPDAVGQQMSQGFGVNVQAPNDLVWGQGSAIGPAQGMGPTDEYLPSNHSGPVTRDTTQPGQWNYWTNGQPDPGNVYKPTPAYHP